MRMKISSFNSKMVRLIVGLTIQKIRAYGSFNSKMVRLIDLRNMNYLPAIGFQFQNGSINSLPLQVDGVAPL